ALVLVITRVLGNDMHMQERRLPVVHGIFISLRQLIFVSLEVRKVERRMHGHKVFITGLPAEAIANQVTTVIPSLIGRYTARKCAGRRQTLSWAAEFLLRDVT